MIQAKDLRNLYIILVPGFCDKEQSLYQGAIKLFLYLKIYIILIIGIDYELKYQVIQVHSGATD